MSDTINILESLVSYPEIKFDDDIVVYKKEQYNTFNVSLHSNKETIDILVDHDSDKPAQMILNLVEAVNINENKKNKHFNVLKSEYKEKLCN